MFSYPGPNGGIPISEAHRLPRDVPYEPLGAPRHQVPPPPVLGRAIVATGFVGWPAPLQARPPWDSVVLSEF